jgi:hypothetical protein
MNAYLFDVVMKGFFQITRQLSKQHEVAKVLSEVSQS